jgi:hypothetical protein
LRVIAAAGLQTSGGGCLLDILTVSSGLATPQVDQIPSVLARAMGVVGGGGQPSTPPIGGAMRVLVRSAGGASIGEIFRPIGQTDEVAQVLDRFASGGCLG